MDVRPHLILNVHKWGPRQTHARVEMSFRRSTFAVLIQNKIRTNNTVLASPVVLLHTDKLQGCHMWKSTSGCIECTQANPWTWAGWFSCSKQINSKSSDQIYLCPWSSKWCWSSQFGSKNRLVEMCTRVWEPRAAKPFWKRVDEVVYFCLHCN